MSGEPKETGGTPEELKVSYTGMELHERVTDMGTGVIADLIGKYGDDTASSVVCACAVVIENLLAASCQLYAKTESAEAQSIADELMSAFGVVYPIAEKIAAMSLTVGGGSVEEKLSRLEDLYRLQKAVEGP